MAEIYRLADSWGTYCEAGAAKGLQHALEAHPKEADAHKVSRLYVTSDLPHDLVRSAALQHVDSTTVSTCSA